MSNPSLLSPSMLELYRVRDCALCDEVEERLRNLVVAHRVNILPSGIRLSGALPPILREGTRLYYGRDIIAHFLDTLERELSLDRQFQSDACYLDPDDPTRCV